MNLDRTAALLQVTDRPSRLARVEQYLEAVMLRVTRQVQIEAKVIEVELRDEFSAGINWRAVLGGLTNNATASQTLAPATTGGFTLALNVGDFSALLNAFAAQGKVNVLSSPRITAMNNEPAVMRIGTQDVFFTTTTQIDAQSGQIVQSTVTPQSLTEGVVLSVTPQISADGIIHMNINPSITERTGVATSRLGDQVPIISVRETDTLVRVRQGETIVIAGLMQDRASVDTAKVPIIGDVPVVGNLFKRTEKTPPEDGPGDPADANGHGPGGDHRHHGTRDPAPGGCTRGRREGPLTGPPDVRAVLRVRREAVQPHTRSEVPVSQRVARQRVRTAAVRRRSA